MEWAKAGKLFLVRTKNMMKCGTYRFGKMDGQFRPQSLNPSYPRDAAAGSDEVGSLVSSINKIRHDAAKQDVRIFLFCSESGTLWVHFKLRKWFFSS